MKGMSQVLSQCFIQFMVVSACLVMSKIHKCVKKQKCRMVQKKLRKKQQGEISWSFPMAVLSLTHAITAAPQCCGACLTSLEIPLFEHQDLPSMGCICSQTKLFYRNTQMNS